MPMSCSFRRASVLSLPGSAYTALSDLVLSPDGRLLYLAILADEATD